MSTLKANSYQHVDRASPSITINSDGSVSIASTVTYEDVTSVDSVGIITARSTIDAQGDVSIADKIIHTGDTNTAIRFPSADTVTVETGGSERARITSVGKVGIGTVTPGSILDVRENKDGAETQIRLFNTDQGNTTTQTAALYLSPDIRGTALTGLRAIKENVDFSTNAGRDVSLTLNTLNNNSQLEALRILSDGSIGINSTSPAKFVDFVGITDADSQVVFANSTKAKSIQIRPNDNTIINYGSDFILNTQTASTNLTFQTGGNERLRITSGGDVGINITPTQNDMPGVTPRLHVLGISTVGQFNTVARFESGTTDGNDTGAAVVINQTNDRGLVIQGGRGGDADGVHHANSGLGRFSIINNSGTFHKFMEAWGQNGQYIENISLFTGNEVERLRIQSNGRVGVGTASARAFLDLCGAAENATLLLDSNDENSNLCLMDNTGSVRMLNYGGALALRVGGTGAFSGDTEKVRIDSSGRVMLGTTTEGWNEADDLTIATTGHTGITVRSGNTSEGNLAFSDATSGTGEYAGLIRYKHNSDSMQFRTAGAVRLTINQDGNSQFTGIVTATEFVPTVTQTGFKNIAINGGMNVDQINGGSAYTGATAYVIDRWRILASGTDENPTTNQHPLTSSDTGPWAKGFRTSLHITNGDQTSGAGSADYISIQQRIEGREMAQSGWEYTSASSYITLSFWVKSSVAQNFYGYLRSMEGTDQRYAFETGSLTANTWKKVTKTVPGDSDIVFNNDNGHGFQINISPFWGDGATTSGVPLNAWSDYSNSTRVPDMTSTWYTTNNSTFEITGVQLEVGSQATPFEHISYNEQLVRCQRYYQKYGNSVNGYTISNLTPMAHSGAVVEIVAHHPTPFRAAPTASFSGTITVRGCNDSNSDNDCTLSGQAYAVGDHVANASGHIWVAPSSGSPWVSGRVGRMMVSSAGAYIQYNAEL